MPHSHITKEAYKLGTVLREKGIKLELEHWDGHKLSGSDTLKSFISWYNPTICHDHLG